MAPTMVLAGDPAASDPSICVLVPLGREVTSWYVVCKDLPFLESRCVEVWRLLGISPNDVATECPTDPESQLLLSHCPQSQKRMRSGQAKLGHL